MTLVITDLLSSTFSWFFSLCHSKYFIYQLVYFAFTTSAIHLYSTFLLLLHDHIPPSALPATIALSFHKPSFHCLQIGKAWRQGWHLLSPPSGTSSILLPSAMHRRNKQIDSCKIETSNTWIKSADKGHASSVLYLP